MKKSTLTLTLLISLALSSVSAANSGHELWVKFTPIQKASSQTMRIPFKPWKTNTELKSALRKVGNTHPESRVTIASQTGSMVPVFDFGDFLVHERIPYEQLREGDIVTFASDDFRNFTALTHRVVKALPSGSFLTRGDASRSNRCDETTTTEQTYVCKAICKINSRTGAVTWF